MVTDRTIKGIFFDVGGTLYSYGSLQSSLMAVLSQLSERLKLDHEAAELAGHYQQANREADKVFAVKPFYLFRDYFGATFTGLLERLDKSHLRDEHFPWFDQIMRETMIGNMQLMPDCHATLTRLKDMGLYLSAVSNADDNQLEPLVSGGELHRWLDHWTSSETARSCKPDRQFFEIALQKSGLSPEQVLFVGDSLEQDIQGAHGIGMTTALITEVDAPAPMHLGRETPEPDFRISSLSELPGIVERMGSQRGR